VNDHISEKKQFEILHHEEIYRGRVFTVIRDDVQHKSGYRGVREVVEHHGGAVVAAMFPNDDVLLIRQFRYPMQREIFELPAGKLDAGEDPQHCAARELSEETGYRAATFQKLTALMTTPGFCSEVLHIYLATDLIDGVQRLEQGEETIDVMRVPIREAIRMCADGEISDGKTIAGLTLTAMKLGLLFSP